MIAVILVLFFLCFLQVTILPINIVLLILISRALIKDEKVNYYLAFTFGLLLSFLAGLPLGSLSLIYLILIFGIHIFRRAQFATHPLIAVPVAAICLIIDAFAKTLIFSISVDYLTIALQTILVIPIYFIILFWEERFIPKKDIKLKVKN